MGVHRKKLVLPYEGEVRNRNDPSASQSVNLACVSQKSSDGQIVAQRERDWSATQVFLISRETPDKISRIQKVTRGPMVQPIGLH